jgi:hypothetical protein
MNPKLEKGDRVCLLYMSGEISMNPGECGTVTSVDRVFGDIQYGVKWDNGSTLSLLSDADAWKFEKKQIKEDELERMNVLYKNIDVFRFFKMGFLHKYLLAVRKASIVNMMESPPYLWMGSERIKHEYKYKNISNEEAFDEMLDMADQAQAEMINGVINYLEDQGIEENMDNINKYLRRFATMIVQNYMHIG